MHWWSDARWRMRLYYFSFFFAAGIYFPYVSLYYKAVHLDGTQIGLLVSISPLVGVMLPALWGTLSDRFGWRNRILRIALLVSALLAPLVPLLQPFGLLLALIVVLSVALSPAVPLADSATLEGLKGAANEFGTVRIFGSIGFLISSVALGVVFAGTHIVWMFPVYGVALAFAAVGAFAVPAQTSREHASRGEGVRFVLRDRRVSIFLGLIILGYTAFAAYNTFFALYLQDLGAGTDVVGIASALATISELPAMLLSGPAIRKFGIKPVLLVGFGSCVVRWLAYAVIHDYRFALAFQPLHGLGFAAVYVAGVSYMDAIVPTRLRSTGQTLFNVSMFGVGSVVGSNLFGLLFDHIHGRGIYFVAAAIAVPAWLGMAAFVSNVRPGRSVVQEPEIVA